MLYPKSEQIDIEVALKEEQKRLKARKQELQTELAPIDQRLDRIDRDFGKTQVQPRSRDTHKASDIFVASSKPLCSRPYRGTPEGSLAAAPDFWTAG